MGSQVLLEAELGLNHTRIPRFPNARLRDPGSHKQTLFS